MHWRPLEDEWVLFEVLSGQTHKMDCVTASVLMGFESGAPLTLQQLLASLQTDLGLVFDAGTTSPVPSAIDQFAALGLIVPAPAPEPLHAAV